MIQWIIGKILKFKNLKEELKKQYLLKADIECIGLTKKEVRELIGIENEEYTDIFFYDLYKSWFLHKELILFIDYEDGKVYDYLYSIYFFGIKIYNEEYLPSR